MERFAENGVKFLLGGGNIKISGIPGLLMDISIIKTGA